MSIRSVGMCVCVCMWGVCVCVCVCVCVGVWVPIWSRLWHGKFSLYALFLKIEHFQTQKIIC